VTFVADELAGVPVEWTVPEAGVTAPELVIVYLHGGGYSNGLAKWARRATSRLALGLGCRVAAPTTASPPIPVPGRARGRARRLSAPHRPGG